MPDEVRIRFFALTDAQFQSAEKDPLALYFITDAQRVYRGAVPFSHPVVVTDVLPEAAAALAGTLYVKTPENAPYVLAGDALAKLGGDQLAVAFMDGSVVAATKTLNFNSALWSVTDGGDGKANVDLNVNFDMLAASKFNSTGGATNPSVANVAVQSRNVALPPDGLYDIGDWSSIAQRSVTTAKTLSYSTAEKFSLPNGTTKFKVEVLQNNTAVFTYTTSEISIDSNATYGALATDNVQVAISGLEADVIGKKASVQVQVAIGSILPNGGRCKVRITHQIGGSSYVKEQEFFYDANPAAPAIGSVTVSASASDSQKKWLSGVEYMSTGATLTFEVANISNLFNQSFVNSALVEVNASNFGAGSQQFTAAQLPGYSASATTSTDSVASLTVTRAVTANQYKEGTISGSARVYDAAWGSNVNSNAIAVKIDSMTSSSTAKKEDFKSETYRKTLALGDWNSTAELGESDLQQGQGGKLFYPAGGSGVKSYIRAFTDTGVAHTNGTLTFAGSGLTEALLAGGTLKVEVSLDGTNWFTMAKDFAGAVSANGDGCRTNADSVKLTGSAGQLSFSLGSTATTASTAGGWGLWIRLTLPSGSTVTSLSINW